MFTEAELIDAKEELLNGKHTIQNCERLAAVCTVLDHLYGEPTIMEYSNDNKTESKIGSYGESQFLKAVEGKPIKDVILTVNELIDALLVLNPRLTSNFMDKLYEI